jgi:mono/diheme cytochrome c family protein
VGVLDESSGKPVVGSLVAEEHDDPKLPPCLLPRAAAVSGDSLYVACMGIDAVVEYDASKAGSGTPERRRWSVPSGPTGIAVHGSRAVVWSQFGEEATLLSLVGDAKSPPVRVPVGRLPHTMEDDQIALGRALFHASSDKRISSDGRACASCHPNGRDDGLVWSTPGGPRQTPMLAGRLPDTAPYGWDGAGSDVAHHLGHTFERLEGQGLPPHELAALEHYVTTLPGPTVHPTPEGQLAHGREVFFSAGCGSCHSVESAFTDGKSHDVGSRAPADAVTAFDTPSLRFVSGTAPYLHDGRYPTLRALLASEDGPMGAARDRPAEELFALEAFVRSL